MSFPTNFIAVFKPHWPAVWHPAHKGSEPVDREQVLDPEDEHRELGLERRERRLLLRLRERADGGPGGDDVPSGARLAEAISSPVHLAGV